MKQILHSGKARLALAALVALLLAGGAWGYFRSNGQGTAQATVGAAAQITITPGTPSADLYPGGSGAVVAVLDNPTAGQVHVNGLDLDSSQGTNGFAVDAAHVTCTDPALSFAGVQTNGGAGWDVAPKSGAVDGTTSVTLPNAVLMGKSASDGCQGATFTVYLNAVS